MADAQSQPEESVDEEAADTILDEPSTEKDPGEEPKAPQPQEGEPSHHAVGIGVIDAEIPGEEE
ncbi:hypothetical protein [Microbacterium sp. KNMS]